jgi:hypothetical protein
VRVQTDDKDPGLLAPFRRRVPAGGFAEVELREDNLKRFTTSTDPAS